MSTAVPTVATTGPVNESRPAVFSATAASLATTLFCAVPEPPVVTTTGVLPESPPSTSRAAASGSSSAVPCRTSVPPAGGGAGERGQVDAAAQVGGDRGAAERHARVGGDGGRRRDARDDVERHGRAADGQHLLDHGVGGVGVAGDEPDDDRTVLGGGHGGLGHLGGLALDGAQLGAGVRVADGVLDGDRDVGVDQHDAGLGQRRGGAGGEHARVTGPCADEDDPAGRAGGLLEARHRVLLILAWRAVVTGVWVVMRGPP